MDSERKVEGVVPRSTHPKINLLNLKQNFKRGNSRGSRKESQPPTALADGEVKQPSPQITQEASGLKENQLQGRERVAEAGLSSARSPAAPDGSLPGRLRLPRRHPRPRGQIKSRCNPTAPNRCHYRDLCAQNGCRAWSSHRCERSCRTHVALSALSTVR